MAQLTVYILSGEFIHAETTPSAPLYHLSKSLDSLTHKVSSIYFSRIISDDVKNKLQGEDESSNCSSSFEPCPADQQRQQHEVVLYNLVHPLNSQYRTDIPAAYYMTSKSPFPGSTLGNIKLVSPSSPSLARKYLLPFHKPTFTALLNPSATSSSSPLFPPAVSSPESGSTVQSTTEQLQVLFTAKPRAGRGGRRVWEWLYADASGKQVIAREEGGDTKKQQQPSLVITAAPDQMTQETKDALVALWVLRLWWAVAEEKEFQKQAIIEMTPPESLSYGGMSKMTKRAGALGGFAAAGGAC
ncbi:hypothetical protein MFIFM68171_05835 [Madurella fahalii]|uniref:Uncharacterized protein n=1 Tax=Madurella fahalii TaxID=1157608 RepID=A0ABQ0GD56_9PEZI